MNAFTIRVELHDATWQNYVTLATDLAAKGITDLIKGNDGKTYKLPPAEYNYEGPQDIDWAWSAADASATRTGRTHAVFVTQASQRKWSGLAVVQARQSA